MSKARGSVAKSNRKFRKMTDAQKRVAVAEDVLKALDLETYVATHGTYICLENDDYARVHNAQSARALQTALNKVSDCQVCAVGAAALSCVRKFDGVTPDEFGNAYEMAERIFPSDQLRRMESAFESGAYGFSQKTATTRLRAIFKNVVKNDGDFVPKYGR